MRALRCFNGSPGALGGNRLEPTTTPRKEKTFALPSDPAGMPSNRAESNRRGTRSLSRILGKRFFFDDPAIRMRNRPWRKNQGNDWSMTAPPPSPPPPPVRIWDTVGLTTTTGTRPSHYIWGWMRICDAIRVGIGDFLRWDPTRELSRRPITPMNFFDWSIPNGITGCVTLYEPLQKRLLTLYASVDCLVLAIRVELDRGFWLEKKTLWYTGRCYLTRSFLTRAIP